jgi:hypothetical protein
MRVNDLNQTGTKKEVGFFPNPPNPIHEKLMTSNLHASFGFPTQYPIFFGPRTLNKKNHVIKSPGFLIRFPTQHPNSFWY